MGEGPESAQAELAAAAEEDELMLEMLDFDYGVAKDTYLDAKQQGKRNRNLVLYRARPAPGQGFARGRGEGGSSQRPPGRLLLRGHTGLAAELAKSRRIMAVLIDLMVLPLLLVLVLVLVLVPPQRMH